MNTMNDYGNDEMEAFPQRLHKMLGEMEVKGKDHIISWNPDGRSFTIRKPKEFAETIMVQYFKNQTRYKSFQRQLNLYRFKRDSQGKTKGVYSHGSFVRDDPELCRFVRRSRKQPRRGVRSVVLSHPPKTSSCIVPPAPMLMHQAAASNNNDKALRQHHQAMLPMEFGLTSSAAATSNSTFSVGLLPSCSAAGGVIPPPSSCSSLFEPLDHHLLGPSSSAAGTTTFGSFCDLVQQATTSSCNFQRNTSIIDLRKLFMQTFQTPAMVDEEDEQKDGDDDDDELSIGSIDYGDIVNTAAETSSSSFGGMIRSSSWAFHPINGEIFP